VSAVSPDERKDEAELDSLSGPASEPSEEPSEEISKESSDESTREGAGESSNSIWPMIATMDYMLVELRELSPMSAHFLRMARQNLLDEFFKRKACQKLPEGR